MEWCQKLTKDCVSSIVPLLDDQPCSYYRAFLYLNQLHSVALHVVVDINVDLGDSD